jgi:hypothetical protein
MPAPAQRIADCRRHTDHGRAVPLKKSFGGLQEIPEGVVERWRRLSRGKSSPVVVASPAVGKGQTL